MYENQTKSTLTPTPASTSASAHALRAPGSGGTATRGTDGTATQRTDPKFVRESNTMRKMLPWQIAALAIAAAVVVALAVFYF